MGKLRFVFGPSGSGKTTAIYDELLKRAKAEPDKNFLIIVPDQFTMQTQWDLSNRSADSGVLNIDILSFGRLTHRILTEVGWENTPVLDDTGKCLVLQRVAGRIEKDLPLLGSKLHRQGYIHEVKSVISEFKQYGISVADLEGFLDKTKSRPALNGKLRDLYTIYKAFEEYTAGNFITREDKLQVLCEVLPKSAIIPDSVVVFDGFTGFTPIQLTVIEKIMSLAGETVVSLVLGREEKIEDCLNEQNLFYLSGKTYAALTKMAEKVKAEYDSGNDIFTDASFRVDALSYLENNLFRDNAEGQVPIATAAITMSVMPNIQEEVHQTGLEICRLLRENPWLQFRQMAIVTGDLEAYGPYVEREFAKMGIPYYIDRTNGVRLNPLIELIRSALDLFLRDFSAENVFHYLRTGLVGIDREEVDRLEFYVKTFGIRGKKKWFSDFSVIEIRHTDNEEEVAEAAAKLEKINATRNAFAQQVLKLNLKSKDTVANYVNAIYDYLLYMEAAENLNALAEKFKEAGDPVREREYLQIYKKVMELLEQIISLMGDEEITLKEFAEILDAGIGEIRVGTIPQTVDKIMVGDIERSRVSSVVAMFFLGVNEGNIPKNSDKGGILSDMDRDLLKDCEMELAPTPREMMYTQRLYLYLNMTKPVSRLYISWANIDTKGKSLRPSYICDVIRKMCGGIDVAAPSDRAASEQIVTRKEGLRFLSDSLRRYVESGEADDELFTIYAAYSDDESEKIRDFLKDAAFISYEPEKLDEKIAKALYCVKKDNEDVADLILSISKLENYAGCPYRFFMQYGLRLQENPEYELDYRDGGNIVHKVLEEFSKKLRAEKISWKDFDDEYAKAAIHEILYAETDKYGRDIYNANERNKYSVVRMERAIFRTIKTIRYQVASGQFEPYKFEDKFYKEMELGRDNDKSKLLLTGVVDRVDIASGERGKYVRIVDYKSSAKTLKLPDIYDGTKLQLPLYLGRELEKINSETGESTLPAGMLYYAFVDPVLENSKAGESKEIAEQEFRKKLKMKGYVSADDEMLILQDEVLADKKSKSDIIPAGYNVKNNALSKASATLPLEDMRTVIEYVEHKAKKQGEAIIGGDIAINPIESGDACNYCSYRDSCSYEKRIPGYEARKVEIKDADKALEAMREELRGL